MELLAIFLMMLIAAGVLYVAAKAALTVRRVGFKRFGRAIHILIRSVSSSILGLFSDSISKRSTDDPFDFSGTGTHYNARTGNHDNGQDPFGNYPFDRH